MQFKHPIISQCSLDVGVLGVLYNTKQDTTAYSAWKHTVQCPWMDKIQPFLLPALSEACRIE